MGILNNNLLSKITDRKLKSAGFKRDNKWGSPSSWNDKTVHWWKDLKIISDGFEYGFVIFYFPDTFEGYVTAFNAKGMLPAGRMLIMPTEAHCYPDWVCKVHLDDMLDIESAIGEFRKWIKKYI